MSRRRGRPHPIYVGLGNGGGAWVGGLILGLVLLIPLIGTIWGILTTRTAGNAYAEVEPQQGALPPAPGPQARVERVRAHLDHRLKDLPRAVHRGDARAHEILPG